jgi:hypothetical protein
MTTGLAIFTAFHTLISIAAVVLGVVVMAALTGKPVGRRWIDAFIITAVATSVTGFFFPFHGMTPAIGVGMVACVVLALVVIGRYAKQLRGAWRTTDAVTLTISEYLLVFVTIAQAFQKVPALRALAPTGTEGPFKAAQAVALVAFIVIGALAVHRVRGAQRTRTAPAA